MPRNTARLRFAFSFALFGAGAYACASSHGANGGADPGVVVPSAGGAGGAGGSTSAEAGAPSKPEPAGTGGTATGGSGGRHPVDVDASTQPPVELTEDAACGIGTATASLRPLTLTIMFDRSGSMINPITVDPVTMQTRWYTATSALSAFFQDSRAAGLNVAMRFFPDDPPYGGCSSKQCDVDACAEPLVDAGVLTEKPAPEDTQEAALLEAIATSTPTLDSAHNGGTPIHAALDGALRWATAYQMNHEDQKTVVLLVTDGSPEGCDEDIQDIATLASDARGLGRIDTYAIGLADSTGAGLDTVLMDRIASFGGTDQAYYIDDGAEAASALLDTLDAIRGQALPCDFAVPAATDDGKPTDTALVNVLFTPAGGTETTFTKVDDAEHCGDASSWYYDNEAAPARIYLCPSACNTVTSEPGAKLEVLVGCKPKLEMPR